MTQARITRLSAILMLAFPTYLLATGPGPAVAGPAETVDHHALEAGAHRALVERLDARGLVADDSWAPLLDPSPIDVVHYDLNLHVDVDREVLAGTVEVEVMAVDDGLTAVELDADQGLRVLSVVLLEDGDFLSLIHI